MSLQSRTMRLTALAAVAIGIWLIRAPVLEWLHPTAVEPVLRTSSQAGRVPGQRVVRETLPAAPSGALGQRTTVSARGQANPFGATEQAVTPLARVQVAPAPAEVLAPVVPVVPPTPPVPSLPFRFVGFFNEPGEAPAVFLNAGGALVIARAGDTLQGGYRLDSIGRREVVFVNPQLNLIHRMRIDGETL